MSKFFPALANGKRLIMCLQRRSGRIHKTNKRRRKLTTIGVKLLCNWKNSSSDWIPLKELKESHPIFLYVNNASIDLFSKQQCTVESSTFRSKSVATRVRIDTLEALRYKPRMMGIKIEGPANIYCENQSLVSTAQH